MALLVSFWHFFSFFYFEKIVIRQHCHLTNFLGKNSKHAWHGELFHTLGLSNKPLWIFFSCQLFVMIFLNASYSKLMPTFWWSISKVTLKKGFVYNWLGTILLLTFVLKTLPIRSHQKDCSWLFSITILHRCINFQQRNQFSSPILW